eukprot:scaffold33574_cov67-Phaeocystis_antarctica.AAC.1
MTPAEAAKLTVPKLKAELTERGLETSGLKAVLLERLLAALVEPAVAAEPAAEPAVVAEPAAAPAKKRAQSAAETDDDPFDLGVVDAGDDDDDDEEEEIGEENDDDDDDEDEVEVAVEEGEASEEE